MTARYPHRTRARWDGQRYWRFACPGCTATGGSTRWRVALDHARYHAARCPSLRDLNRRALACWNCDGRGVVAGGACVVCLGDGWTTEPGPTAIGRRP